ncbi:MAG: bifunctional transcriptional activator/DNA repair enzyme protein Ada [Acidocella sp. 20-61-6]|nr:MAG: bifunctional transcriptional activator/DNA repair enzyme protein Ada [Acidocella sp. 20-61-6]
MPRDGAATDTRADKIAASCRAIEAAEALPKLAELARAAGLSPYHFHRLFKTVTGLTPRAYAAARRDARLRAALAESASVTEAIYEAGFNSSGRFYAQADAALGMTPTAYRAQGRGETLRFAIGQCRLGAILVAASARGICEIALGDDPAVLAQALQDRFPKAELIGGDVEFERMVARVVGFVQAPSVGLDLPLDIRGTAFQRRVWQALRQIPPGQTATYREIAAQVCTVKATRAVAGACAANRLAIAIPCHRVVRQDGGLAGYAAPPLPTSY